MKWIDSFTVRYQFAHISYRCTEGFAAIVSTSNLILSLLLFPSPSTNLHSSQCIDISTALEISYDIPPRCLLLHEVSIRLVPIPKWRQSGTVLLPENVRLLRVEFALIAGLVWSSSSFRDHFNSILMTGRRTCCIRAATFPTEGSVEVTRKKATISPDSQYTSIYNDENMMSVVYWILS